jgi:RHS repeat-associated protein
VFTETKYDNLGRVAATSNPYREGDVKYWSKPRYDELNRVVETFAPEIEGQTGASLGITEFGISTVQGFVGTYTTATDASGRKARSITNALGQLVRIDEPTGTNNDLGLIGSPNQPTYYKYNPQGKMVKVSQGQQNRYFLYDYLGRLIRVRQPEQEVNSALDLADTVTNNNQWTAGFEYDIVGNLKKTTDAKGSVITNSYDKAGRVTLREYNNLDTPSVYYYYDGTGLGAVPQYSKGKLTKVSSSISATQYTSFDNFGRTLTSEQITDGQTYTSKYKYNLSGALLEQTYPSGKVVRNFLESDGDLGKIVRNGKVYASDMSYTSAGILERIKLGNGLWESAKMNARQQVEEINLGTSPTDGSKWQVKYEYGEIDANGNTNIAKNTGNISKQTINFNGLAQPFVQTYKYDALDRIVEAKENNGTATGTQNWKQTYNYDRFGNRLNFSSLENGKTAITTTPQIDPLTNRFNLGQGFEYDKAGNIKKDTSTGITREFVFNGDNKQVHVKDANNVAIGTYFYDGEGKRVKKTTASETTIFVYDGGGKLVAEYSTATPTTSPTVSYTATDTLGSPRVITDKNGNVTSRRDFLPFGEELNANNATNRLDTQKYNYGEDGVRKRFTGYEKDLETGLDFAEARYYNNQHGRFTAVDPLLASGKSRNPQTFNRYVYVMNRPLLLTDPSGMQVGSTPFTFSLYTRAFAPFEWFAQGSHARGDNRGFSTDPQATYRISAYTEMTTTDNGTRYPTSITRASPPALSEERIGPFSWSAYSEAYVYNPDGTFYEELPGGNENIAYWVAGNDDAIPFVSGNIDLHPSFWFKYSKQENGVVDMSVTGTVTGDQFPAAESFIRDNSGNSIMLGVFAPSSESTPETALPFNGTSPMINVNLTVRVQNGVFQGVVENGNLISIDEWNKRFTSQPAVRPVVPPVTPPVITP